MCCKIGTVFGFLFGCLGAAGQSSSDIATFGAIRTAVRDRIQGNRNFQLFRDKQYDLFLCSYPGQLGMSDSPLEPAAMVALHIETYRAELTRLRVPESVWSRNLAALDQFGARSVRWNGAHDNRFDDMMRQVEKGLADSVIAYGRSAPGGPQFMWEGGCGAGEAEVTITSTPGGARISYISLFQYRLCQHRNVNPEDSTRCEGWISAVKLHEDMIGTYRYIAAWPGGYQSRGMFDISGKTTVNITR